MSAAVGWDSFPFLPTLIPGLHPVRSVSGLCPEQHSVQFSSDEFGLFCLVRSVRLVMSVEINSVCKISSVQLSVSAFWMLISRFCFGMMMEMRFKFSVFVRKQASGITKSKRLGQLNPNLYKIPVN